VAAAVDVALVVIAVVVAATAATAAAVALVAVAAATRDDGRSRAGKSIYILCSVRSLHHSAGIDAVFYFRDKLNL
jgi:NO-binding membrane sensor protein with MHYT domain